MPRITGFSTVDKEQMMQQLKDAGTTVKMPFVAEGLKTSKNPLDGFTVKNSDGSTLNINKTGWFW